MTLFCFSESQPDDTRVLKITGYIADTGQLLYASFAFGLVDLNFNISILPSMYKYGVKGNSQDVGRNRMVQFPIFGGRGISADLLGKH